MQAAGAANRPGLRALNGRGGLRMDENPMVSIPLALGILLAIPLAVLCGIVLERRVSGLKTPRWVLGTVLFLGALVLGAALIAAVARVA